MVTIKKHQALLDKDKTFKVRLAQAFAYLKRPSQAEVISDELKVDSQLYDGFLSETDKIHLSAIRAASAKELATLTFNFQDPRLSALLPLYKARNFPEILTEQENAWWQAFRQRKLLGGGTKSVWTRYNSRLSQLQKRKYLSQRQRQALIALSDYGAKLTSEVASETVR